MGPLHSDLALEAHETLMNTSKLEDRRIHGVEVTESCYHTCKTNVTIVSVSTKNGAKAIGKPMGEYITMEIGNPADLHDELLTELIKLISLQIRSLLNKERNWRRILLVGLGNKNITADALGPFTVEKITVNRHLYKECEKSLKSKYPIISSFIPGVMSQNGMETAESLKGVVDQTKPDLIIAIDSLAARNVKRLKSTIQLTNTGILPGSGVGNHRVGITKETMGIPVIAIGIPMVVDAATIVRNAIEGMEAAMGENLLDFDNPSIGGVLQQLSNMYVTGKDIDEQVKILSHVLSESINLIFSHTDISGADMA